MSIKNTNNDSKISIESEQNNNNLKDAYYCSKRKEKRLILKIHRQNQEIEEYKTRIDEINLKISKLNNLGTQDLCYDRCLNNELNSLVDIRNDLETKIEEIKLTITKKKIEIGETSMDDKQHEIMKCFEKNKELGKKIESSYMDKIKNEIQEYKKMVDELKEEKKKILAEITEFENEQKNENEVISTTQRMLKEQELKNLNLQKEIDELKEQLKIK